VHREIPYDSFLLGYHDQHDDHRYLIHTILFHESSPDANGRSKEEPLTTGGYRFKSCLAKFLLVGYWFELTKKGGLSGRHQVIESKGGIEVLRRSNAYQGVSKARREQSTFGRADYPSPFGSLVIKS